MAENLPLIPEKQSALCGDVQTVLRDVFREFDYLPPLVRDPLLRVDQKTNEEDSSREQWIDKLSADHNDLYVQEEELKQEFAHRLAREPLPNIYRLHSPADSKESVPWRRERGIIGRRDLRPSLEQNATRDTSLWIKNILNRSSGDLRKDIPKKVSDKISVNLKTFEKGSLQSISMGELISQPPPPPLLPVPPPPEPEYIICIPPQLDFVNFTVGHLHTQSLRLVNITKFEVRLSIRPPAHRELSVELCSRLALSAGASATLLLHYRPQDVRELTDELMVRVSAGRSITVPVCCYMEPPVLDILIPNTPSSKSNSVEDFYDISDVLDLGAKLVGDVHRTPVIFYCGTNHAAFFLLSEDSWLNGVVDISPTENSCTGHLIGVASDCFWISPAYWAGGGTVTGLSVCRATSAGVHTSVFRILCSTAIVRSINLVADAMLFKPDHITIQAHEKDYDICSPDDPACQYYVNLGVAFPHRSLVAGIEIVNHSPITYEYYWSMRRWGVCSCWETSESEESLVGEQESCPGAPRPSTEDKDNDLASYRNVCAVHPEPAHGHLLPRCSSPVQVRVPDVGEKLGIQRAVLMLVLKDIPKESFPPDLDPMIVRTKVVDEDSIPGLSPAWSREVCDVACVQVEVWWEVTPVVFMVDQPLLILPHSRRIKSLTIPLRATQVTGVAGVSAKLKMDDSDIIGNQVSMKPGHTTVTNFKLPLKNLPDEHPEMKILQIVADNDEWSTTTRIHTSCITRHPALRPAIVWLGLVPPGARVQTQITIKNDTYQHIYWWASSWRWWHENPPGEACKGRTACPQCHQHACTCSLLRPTRGALAQGEKMLLSYDVYAPDTDGSVATLIQVRRTAGDLGYVPCSVGSDGRVSLIAYRVLAPKLVLKVLPCFGDKHASCETCVLNEGLKASKRGTSVLRPSGALTVGRCACYRLKCTNLTPLPTTLRWEPPIEGEDALKVTFIPNDIDVGAHAVVDIKVVVKPMKVCGRRIFVHRASVQCAHLPVYLLIDTAIKGLEITIEVPLGGADVTDSFVIMRRSQVEELSRSSSAGRKPLSTQEYFQDEDKKRELQQENICHCRYKMVYIPPKKPLSPPKNSEDEEYSIDIVTEPPSLTRVCPCTLCTKPVIPENQEPLCLQFQKVPIRTVRSKTIIIRNLSTIHAKWSTAVRRWPRHHVRTLAADQWASDIRDPGIAVQCSPSQGVVTSRGHVEVAVCVYADCWGLYREQVLVHVENIEPIILDVWVEAVGCPLEFPIKPDLEDTPPLLWMTSSDPERVVNVTNTSRADLVVQALTMKEHGHPQDTLPFRLYIRFYDVLPRTCPCCKTIKSESISEEQSSSSVTEEIDTDIEIMLLADYGLQSNDYYQVDTEETIIPRGTTKSWRVRLLPTWLPVPPGVMLLRTKPVLKSGDCWYRPSPAPQSVLLRAAHRSSCVQLAPPEIRVSVCALDLPFDDVMRVRKPFSVHNAGDGPLACSVVTAPPWRALRPSPVCSARCQPRGDVTELDLPAKSCLELCVELSLRTRDAWPAPGDTYPTRQETTTPLSFFDENYILLASMQLILELELPIIQATPTAVHFGSVTDGDTRKTYITVSHTSHKTPVELVTKLEGSTDFRVHPRNFVLSPGTKGRVYVQYSSRWRTSPAEATLHISAASGAGGWCTARVSLAATSTRDWLHRRPIHDYTDDNHLLPESVVL